MKFLPLILILFLISCSYRKEPTSDTVVSLQLIDRNGMAETISNQERLKTYEGTDFLTSQPYQKVLRVYGRNSRGGVPSKITAYHPNGKLWQYLEVLDGRANGLYTEWYPNGQKKVEAFLIEGPADLSDLAKVSWVFDGTSTVWNEQGEPLAVIEYTQGVLNASSVYFHSNGSIAQIIPYQKGLIHGTLVSFDEEGNLIEQIPYTMGQKHGKALSLNPVYEESYEMGLLQEATYGSPILAKVSQGFGKKAIFNEDRLEQLIEIRHGKEEGLVEIFRPQGVVAIRYTQIDGKKTGEEIEYYPNTPNQPKIALSWHEDILHGPVKTWYENGTLESQREFHNNKKEGLSFAWYKNGSLLCVEEYEDDRLIKGSYFKKNDKNPVSKIEEGKGVATLYSSEGLFLKKIVYEKGTPIP